MDRTEHSKVAVVAFGFGEPWKANPNSRIAALALHHARGTSHFILTDRDVYPHLAHSEHATVEQIDPSRVPTTYRLAVMAIQRAKARELSELYVVAAPCHMWRCLRDLRWAADDAGVTITLIPRPIGGGDYDPHAATWFTHAAWLWWPLEIAYRAVSNIFPEWYKRTHA